MTAENVYSSVYYGFFKELILVWTVEARQPGQTFAVNCVVRGKVENEVRNEG